MKVGAPISAQRESCHVARFRRKHAIRNAGDAWPHWTQICLCLTTDFQDSDVRDTFMLLQTTWSIVQQLKQTETRGPYPKGSI